MHPTHHIDRSRHYLAFASRDAAAGDYARAARALARSASHAATAAAVHWHHGHGSRRRLAAALSDLVYDRLIPYSHLRTFRDVYRLLEQVSDETPAESRRAVRRMRRRVVRFCAAIELAIADRPVVPTLEQILDDPRMLPAPDPVHLIDTMGELRELTGRYIDSAHADHPIGCRGCRVRYHESNPVPHP